MFNGRLSPLDRRSLIATAAILLALLMFSLLQTVKADFPPPGYEERRTFYSDSSKTTIVGGWWFDCNQEIRTWGQQTGYVSYVRTQCTEP
jgi:hypothetical protein